MESRIWKGVNGQKPASRTSKGWFPASLPVKVRLEHHKGLRDSTSKTEMISGGTTLSHLSLCSLPEAPKSQDQMQIFGSTSVCLQKKHTRLNKEKFE